MKQVISYSRVSTPEQALNGFGLDGQQRQIDAYAERMGYSIKKRYCEQGISAMGEDNVAKRPEFQKAVAHAKRRGWPIIVSDINRASRHAETFESLLADGVKIISASDGDVGDPAVARGKAARAQLEGEEISKRTRRSLAIKKSEGVRMGNRKNLPEAQRRGSQANRRLARLRAEELRPFVEEARLRGLTGHSAIAGYLNKRGLRTPRGKQWTKSNVRRLLVRIPQQGQVPGNEITSHPMWGIF